MIAVADTMYLCKQWFESYMPKTPASPFDVVAMAALIIGRENKIGIAGTLSNINDAIHTCASNLECLEDSKYPPAKPGALSFGPLKAA